MGYEDQGSGFDPGAAGHELQGRAKGPEKSREVAPAVAGVMAALKAAAAKFCEYEIEAQRIGGNPAADRQMAQMCETAAADLEGMLAASFQRVADATDRPKAPPSPSALFRAGFDYGAMAMLYEQIPEDARPARWGEKPVPPPTWEAAWAIVRAQIAAAK